MTDMQEAALAQTQVAPEQSKAISPDVQAAPEASPRVVVTRTGFQSALTTSIGLVMISE